ncbi:MAG: acyl-CoA dehydrogenase family protein [Rhodospirillaceae bacterium]|nr:acyl-CoA dehydrogenase family protein [Rhodospirillaceae bacterium]
MSFELGSDQQDLKARAHALAREVLATRAADIDRTEQYPWDNVQALTDAGFMGMTIPTAYGGRGASFLDAVAVIEEIAQVCGVSARIVVEANMGGISAVMKYGDDAQKRLAAGLVLAGDKPAICITEPDAGSAASQMATRADRHGDTYVLNGRKHWITGGGVSRLHVIFARVFEDGEEQGIAAFLAVRGETEGLKIGERAYAMGMRGVPETEILFEDMVVPRAMMIVPPRGLRHGFGGLMNAYNSQRVGAATVALGVAEGAYGLALEHVKERQQFGRPIAEFQGLQWMLADMSIQISAAQGLIYRAAASAGDGFPDMEMAAKAKIFTSEMAIRVTNDALQLFGAAGYGRDMPLERMVRDARMFTIGGGTAQVLRTLVASREMGRKLPQTRDGYAPRDAAAAALQAAE